MSTMLFKPVAFSNLENIQAQEQHNRLIQSSIFSFLQMNNHRFLYLFIIPLYRTTGKFCWEMHFVFINREYTFVEYTLRQNPLYS